jgi:hypothetical protein
MNILFISPHEHLFNDVATGTEQRTSLLIKACAEIGIVDILAFHRVENFNEPNTNILYNQPIVARKINKKITRFEKWRSVIHFWDVEAMFPRNKKKSEIVKHFFNKKKYDLVVTRYVHRAIEYGLNDYYSKLVVDVDDLPADVFINEANVSETVSSKIRNRLSAKIVDFHTRKLVKRAKATFFPNPVQARKFNGIYLPNIPYHQSLTCETIDFSLTNKRLFFIGLLTYEPNYSGVDYFLKNIYTRLHERLPDIEFYIAGKFSNQALKDTWESYPDVKVLGFVNDIREAYAKSRVVVIPIYKGAGTNIKLLEAMRMNRVCAVSEFSTRGLTEVFEDKKDYFVAHSDEEYIENIIRLMVDENLNKTTAENAFEKVNKFYSYTYFAEVVKNALNN